VKVSPGCKHCYAETLAERFRGAVMPNGKLHVFHGGFDPQLRPERLEQPIAWKRPRRIFVNSMSDLFGDFVPTDYLEQVFRVMAVCRRHTFQVLTKRADRMAGYSQLLDPARFPNVWLGVSVEDRKYGLPRIAWLQRSQRLGVRFLSIEPLLEDLGELDLTDIDWVIVGGESGHGAREMRIEWVRDIRDQCMAQGVPFFFKQWGGIRKRDSGRLLDHRTWDDMPAVAT
jgi:protein gp37